MDTSKIKQTVEPFSQQGAPSMVGTETVSEATPGKIAVYDPSRYTSKVRDHEMTHEFQQSRSDGTVKLPGGYALAPLGVHPAMAPEQYAAGDPRNYDYGGQAGLQSLRSAPKSRQEPQLLPISVRCTQLMRHIIRLYSRWQTFQIAFGIVFPPLVQF